LATLASIFSLFLFKLNFSIEFTGGTILEIEYLERRPEIRDLERSLFELELKEFMIQPAGENEIILRTKELNPDLKEKTIEKLKEFGKLREVQSETIGPIISKELKEKAFLITILSICAIIIYISIAFKNLSPTIPAWQCALVVIFCLLHDLILPLGVFSFLGRNQNVQFSIPLVIAFLTIIGYSINNVVVVFDRVREIVQKFPKKSLYQVADEAINQTLTRQINTSLTTLFPLITIFFLVGESLKYFSLVLILGISFGTYSSIFLATPLLVTLRERFKNKKS